jgi:thiamine monophosphate synthase
VAGPTALTGAARVAAPVLAIGGVTSPARDCRAAGAAGLAAIGAFLPPGSGPGAVGPTAAIAAFRRAWSEGSGAAG